MASLFLLEHNDAVPRCSGRVFLVFFAELQIKIRRTIGSAVFAGVAKLFLRFMPRLPSERGQSVGKNVAGSFLRFVGFFQAADYFIHYKRLSLSFEHELANFPGEKK